MARESLGNSGYGDGEPSESVFLNIPGLGVYAMGSDGVELILPGEDAASDKTESRDGATEDGESSKTSSTDDEPLVVSGSKFNSFEE